MIRINLLPDEYRRKARTPVKLMLSFAGAVTINASLLAYYGWVSLAVAGAVESEKQTLELEMEGLQPQVTYFDSLQAEKSQHQSREDTLASIMQSRISWTRKIDEFIDVVNQGGEGQRHLVWFSDFNVTQNTDPNAPKPGTVTAKGHSGSADFSQMAEFLDDLERSPFVTTDFSNPADPEGRESVTDEELVPSTVWTFPLSLDLVKREGAQ